MGDLSTNFSRYEFECRCQQYCGGTWDTVDAELILVLEDARQYFRAKYPSRDVRITINSGNRCPGHNKDEGGSPKSQHVLGKAADIVVQRVHEDEVYDYLDRKYPGKYAVIRYNRRTHIDVRETEYRGDKR